MKIFEAFNIAIMAILTAASIIGLFMGNAICFVIAPFSAVLLKRAIKEYKEE